MVEVRLALGVNLFHFSLLVGLFLFGVWICVIGSVHPPDRLFSVRPPVLRTPVTLPALSSTPTNPHSCFAWSYKALAMLVDCMWGFVWRLEGSGEDSHKACSLFESAIVVSNHRAITC